MKKSTLLATIILFSLLQRSHAANLNGMPWQGDYEYAITAEELGNETNPINIDLEYLEKMMEESDTQRRQAAKLLRDRGADIEKFEKDLLQVIDLPRIEAIENNDTEKLEHIAKLEKAFIEITVLQSSYSANLEGDETNPINIDLEYLEKMMEESETQRRQAAKLLRDRGADIPEFEDALFKVIDLPRIEAIENNDRKTLEHIAKLEKAFIEIRLQNNNQDLS